MSSNNGSTRAIIAAFAANLGIAAAKFLGFAFTGSASMLSESLHSVADTGNQGLLLLGYRRSSKRPDERHPFGYARERYFWAFVVSLVLFSLGALFSIVEGIDKIVHPHDVESVVWAFAILGVAIVLESLSLRTATRQARATKGNRSWIAYIRHGRDPELPVVLLEDLGALTGLSIAIIALVLTEVTGDAVWDGVGTLGIGVVLALIAVVLAIEMKSLLIGESATRDERRLIADAVASAPSVVQLIHIRTEHLGPEELLVGAKIQFRDGLSVSELADAINDVEARIRARVPSARYLYIEPDIMRSRS